MRPTLRNVVSVAAACALIGGCKDRETPPAPISPPDLELVSAGNEPRQVLRYRAPRGTEQKLEVAVGVSLTAGDMGGAMPTIVMQMTYVVDVVLPTGQLVVHATIDQVTARDAEDSKVPAAALAGPLATLDGITIYSVLSPSGRVRGSRLDKGTKTVSPEIEAQLQSLIASFESTVMTLPDEPVGVGAVWRNSRPVQHNGLALKAVNSVTLTAMRGDVIEYSIDTDIHGHDQSVKQGDITIEVKDVIGNGGGKGTLDLATLAITSELAAEFRASMTATGDTAPTPMRMTTQLNVRPL